MPAAIRLLAVLCLLAVLPTARADDVPIHGQVADLEGNALAGVTVELLPVLGGYESGLVVDDPPPVATARSRADGSFVVQAPAAGPWIVRLSAGRVQVVPWNPRGRVTGLPPRGNTRGSNPATTAASCSPTAPAARS